MKRLLVTGGGGSATEALCRLLADHYELHFADADAEAFPPCVPQARRCVVPSACERGFVGALADACRGRAIDVLIPTVDEELHHVWSVARAVRGLAVLAPPPEFISLALDKYALMTRLAELGLDHPRTMLFQDINAIGFPAFVKPRTGRGSRGAQAVADRREADAYFVLSGLTSERIVAQERLVGREYSVMMAAGPSGKLGAIVPVRIDVKRGVTIRGATEAQDDVIDYCVALHERFGISGIYNIQLILTPEQRVLPFEINPRMSTTTCLAIAAGIDPIAVVTGAMPATAPAPFRAGVGLARFWHNEITGAGAA